MDNKKKKLVTIGGGKGQGMILSGLRKHADKFELSAIVSMVDNGGSTGRFREELNIPPFGGDFKDVLTSLSSKKAIVDLFQHRYEKGNDIKGHTVGNLILLGLLEMSDWDIPKATEIALDILDIENEQVYPSTLDQVHLVAKYEDGSVVTGQDEIDNNMTKKFQRITEVNTEPIANVYGPAAEAIMTADLIVLCPGDLYGSLLCNIVIPGIKEALAKSTGKIIYVTNLMTKVNQTHGWAASEFIKEVQRYIPRTIDYAIVNTGLLPSDISGKDQYAEEHWEMVQNDIETAAIATGTNVIKQAIWFEGKEFRRVSTDVIPRSFIRHDPDKIADIIAGL